MIGHTKSRTCAHTHTKDKHSISIISLSFESRRHGPAKHDTTKRILKVKEKLKESHRGKTKIRVHSWIQKSNVGTKTRQIKE